MASRTTPMVASCSKVMIRSKKGVSPATLQGDSVCGVTARASRAYASSSSSRRQPGTSSTTSLQTPTIPRLPDIPGPHNLSQPQAAFLTPRVHPRTHNVHVASIQLRSHVPDRLVEYTDFALHAAHALGIPCSRAASLPVDRSLYTVTKSPFVHKKAQENFERRTHKRLIKAFDAEPEVLEKWFRYLQKYSLGGVGIKAELHEWAEVGCGAKEMEEVLSGLRKDGLEDRVRAIADGVKRELGLDAEVDRHAADAAKEPEAESGSEELRSEVKLKETN